MIVTCIIDMEPRYPPADSAKIQNECIKLARRAIKKNHPIVILEYMGESFDIIRRIPEVYPKAAIIQKVSVDGSGELNRFMQNEGIKPKGMIFAGVETNVCVKWTMKGIRNLYPDIPLMLAIKATGDPFLKRREGVSNILNLVPNVKLIK